MQFRSKVALVAAVCGLSLGVGGALAESPKAGPATAAAAYIGVSISELREQLRAGNSLANIAVAHGKSVDGLEAAIVADAKSHLDKAVADGKLTADRAAQILATLKSKVVEIVMRTGAPAGKGKPGKGKAGKGEAAARAAVKSAATYLGLSIAELRTQLQAGKSLAQVATARGTSVEGLKAAIVADAKAVIDKLVASGKISAERGKQYLAQIEAHVDGFVNRTKTSK